MIRAWLPAIWLGLGASLLPASAQAEWYVVIGSYPASDYDSPEKALASAARCGFAEGQWENSSMIEDFAPDLHVAYLGPTSSRAQAEAIRRKVAPCVPDAFVKFGAARGE